MIAVVAAAAADFEAAAATTATPGRQKKFKRVRPVRYSLSAVVTTVVAGAVD